MTHAFVTVSVPFPDSHAGTVEGKLDELGNPAKPSIRDALRDRGIHFMSITVVRGDRDHGAFLVLEASADGTVDSALDTISARLGAELIDVLRATGHGVPVGELKGFLQRHSHKIGFGLLATAGLCFSGTPGMSVERINREYELARRVRDIVAEGTVHRTPLNMLKAVQARIASEPEFAPLLQPEFVELLLPPPKDPGAVALALRLGARGVWTFGWPYLVPASLAALAVTAYAWCIGGALFAWACSSSRSLPQRSCWAGSSTRCTRACAQRRISTSPTTRRPIAPCSPRSWPARTTATRTISPGSR